MSKVKPLLACPVDTARRVLAECDVRHPRDIRIEVIAARYGAMIVYGPLATARGSIVRAATRAVIWIDERAKGEARANFTGAHELGHHLLHGFEDHFAQCDGMDALFPSGSAEQRDAGKRVRLVEREADHFSIELLMPGTWAGPLCDVRRPSLDDVYRLSRVFNTSFHTSAIRFVELTPWTGGSSGPPRRTRSPARSCSAAPCTRTASRRASRIKLCGVVSSCHPARCRGRPGGTTAPDEASSSKRSRSGRGSAS